MIQKEKDESYIIIATSAGRGNVHKRPCKFFTPGLLKILRQYGKINHNVLPFWIVFQIDFFYSKNLLPHFARTTLKIKEPVSFL